MVLELPFPKSQSQFVIVPEVITELSVKSVVELVHLFNSVKLGDIALKTLIYPVLINESLQPPGAITTSFTVNEPFVV